MAAQDSAVDPVGRDALLAVCPELRAALGQYESAIERESKVAPLTREVAVLTVLRRSRSEVAARLPAARAAGISDAMIEAILDEDWTDACFDPAQKAAFQFALQYDAGHTISDAVLASARENFSEPALVELALVCGHYGALARFAVGFRLDHQAS